MSRARVRASASGAGEEEGQDSAGWKVEQKMLPLSVQVPQGVHHETNQRLNATEIAMITQGDVNNSLFAKSSAKYDVQQAYSMPLVSNF